MTPLIEGHVLVFVIRIHWGLIPDAQLGLSGHWVVQPRVCAAGQSVDLLSLAECPLCTSMSVHP
jgi:hypothetical protein